MPKVISGVAGAKAFATEGTVQSIPDVTNRQGAKKALEIAVGKALDARKEPTAAAAVAEPVKAPETVGQKPPETVPPAQEPDEGQNEEPDTEKWPENYRKAYGYKQRELTKARNERTKALAELADTENFSKAQYARAAAAEERVEALQRELEGLKAKAPEAPKPVTNPKPDPKDFYDEKGQFKLPEYTEAVGKWSAAEALAESKAKDQKEREEAQARAMEEARQKAFETAKKRTEEQSKQYSDWDQVVPGTPIQLHTLVGAYMQASPHIGHIGYYLAKHPEYVEQLNKMNPLDAIGELGELCIRWKNKTSQKEPEKVKEEIKPPAPITTLPGIGATGVATDPSKMTPAQLRAYDRERAMAKKRA